MFAAMSSSTPDRQKATANVTPRTGDVVSEGAVRARDPVTVVIFGASGDLAKRKLVPALFQLEKAGFLPDFVIDVVYRFIARNRYRWFGKLDACPLPNPGDAAKFLDEAGPVSATA